MAKFVENTESDILCPQCDPPRKLIVKTNRHTDHQFLGCPNYPECNFTRGIPEEWVMRANGQPSLFDVLSAPNNACSGQVAGAGNSDGDSTSAATCH